MPRMQQHAPEFADFVFGRRKVVVYGLRNGAGDTTTVLTFPTGRLADAFRAAFLRERNFRIIQQGPQISCLADYTTVMRPTAHDPRVQPLGHGRPGPGRAVARLAV